MCIGIYFGIKDIREILNKTEINMREKEKVDLEYAKTEAKNNSRAKHIYEALEESTRDVYTNSYQLIQARKERVLKIEGIILIIGTLIWGFGDLLVFA